VRCEKLTELKISGFKMFEKAPYERPDVKTFVDLLINDIKGEDKVYGPVFTGRAIKYALWFINKKTGEATPKDIKTLEQLAEYLVSISSVYPSPYCALSYAQIKAENDLQGQVGAGIQVAMLNASRSIARGSSLIKERNIDVDDVLVKMRNAGVAMKACPSEMGYRKNEDGNVDLIFPNCYFLDSCRTAFHENILKRPDGRMACPVSSFSCQFFKLLAGYEWDYNLLEFDKPYCISQFYIF
jgi:hypothetical protein